MLSKTHIADLRNFGYRIIVVDWHNSRQEIQNNAINLIGLIDYLKCSSSNGNADIIGDEQFTIIGESMGGLVARYALAYMEKNSSGTCATYRFHNTRLLITFDTPHGGANIPLAYQHYYRDPGLLSFGATSITQQFFGLFNNMLIDAASAKQMFLYHVDTRNPILETYTHHPLRDVFMDDLKQLGDYPQFTKLVALSNGSLRGIGQSRIWDGVQRVPNDVLLDLDQEGIFRVFGTNFKLFGARFLMNSLPSGNGPLCSSDIGTWSIKIKLKWFGLKVVLSTNSLISKTYNGRNLEPYDVIPGSYDGAGYEENTRNSISDIFFNGEEPVNMGNGQYELKAFQFGWKNGSGMRTSIRSDGSHFCFVPVFSSLDYKISSYWEDIEGDSILAKTSKSPFDIISGITERYYDENIDTLIVTPLTTSLRENYFRARYNKEHLFVKNIALGSYQNTDYVANPLSWFNYTGCDDENGGIVRWINREIGDDTLIIDNREMPYDAAYVAEEYIGVNEPGLYYEYPSSSTALALPGIYSKEGFLIASSGVTLYARAGNVNYNPPITGSINVVALDWNHCCVKYAPGQRLYHPISSLPDGDAVIKVYPNPVVGNKIVADFTSKFDPYSYVRIYDLFGRIVYEQNFEVDVNADHYSISVQISKDISAGNYIFVIKNADKVYRKSILIVK